MAYVLVFWDFGRIMTIEPMEHRGSKLGSMGFFKKANSGATTISS
jgi:hypothetical protein